MTPNTSRAITTALSLLAEARFLLTAALSDTNADYEVIPDTDEETPEQVELSNTIAFLEDSISDLDNAVANATTAQEEH